MQTLIASDDVTDAIVQIEMHRMEMQKETGAIGAGNEALRRLHEKNEYRCRSGATAPARFRPRHRSRLRERNNAFRRLPGDADTMPTLPHHFTVKTPACQS